MNINALRRLAGCIAYLLIGAVSLKAQQPVFPPAAYNSPVINYIRTWVATAPVTDPNALLTKTLKDVTKEGKKNAAEVGNIES